MDERNVVSVVPEHCDRKMPSAHHVHRLELSSREDHDLRYAKDFAVVLETGDEVLTMRKKRDGDIALSIHVKPT